eukprot:m.162201 g.162201  ORF g.162201 m.162201 type:complete len:235 (-) comp12159_c0_seq1:72-776(-)
MRALFRARYFKRYKRGVKVKDTTSLYNTLTSAVFAGPCLQRKAMVHNTRVACGLAAICLMAGIVAATDCDNDFDGDDCSNRCSLTFLCLNTSFCTVAGVYEFNGWQGFKRCTCEVTYSNGTVVDTQLCEEGPTYSGIWWFVCCLFCCFIGCSAIYVFHQQQQNRHNAMNAAAQSNMELHPMASVAAYGQEPLPAYPQAAPSYSAAPPPGYEEAVASPSPDADATHSPTSSQSQT